MKKEVADIEVYPNFFCYVGFDVDTKEWYSYHLHDSMENDIRSFIDRMLSGIAMIGFNNQGYDYPVIHTLLYNRDKYSRMTSSQILTELKKTNDGIIGNEKKRFIKPLIPILDLYKIHGFDNPAKASSLKWLEVNMRLPNVEDLPFTPDTIVKAEDIDTILQYCNNDVEATYQLYLRSLNKISFRVNMTKKFNFDLMNYSDVKIGTHVNRDTYCKLSNVDFNDIKYLRTKREEFHISDMIPSYAEFKLPELQKFLSEISKMSFKKEKETKKGKSKPLYSIILDDLEISFAKGGLHSVDRPRILERRINGCLVEKDVGSMYPKGIINDEIYPEHLGVNWTRGIENSYNYRLDVLKPKLKQVEYKSPEWNMINDEQETYKLSMNGGGFGQLGNEYNWQYDELAKYRVTIGGQIKLLMLVDMFISNGIQVLSANTDGIVIDYLKEQQSLVDSIHTEWERITGFVLEDTFYNRIFMTSVNDYIAEIIDPKTDKIIKIKYKGDFEIDCELHKDSSMRVVRIAVARDLMFGVSYTQTLRDHLSEGFYEDLKVENHRIYDFCKAVRSKGGAKFELFSRTTLMKPIPLPKTVRYYMSKSGMSIRKILPPNLERKGHVEKIKEQYPNQMSLFDFVEDVRVELERPSEVEAGNDVIIFNRFIDGPYDIDMSYYENECRKIIDKIRR